jgi:hypothetical protein
LSGNKFTKNDANNIIKKYENYDDITENEEISTEPIETSDQLKLEGLNFI